MASSLFLNYLENG